VRIDNQYRLPAYSVDRAIGLRVNHCVKKLPRKVLRVIGYAVCVIWVLSTYLFIWGFGSLISRPITTAIEKVLIIVLLMLVGWVTLRGKWPDSKD
jgi:hypothetical protein